MNNGFSNRTNNTQDSDLIEQKPIPPMNQLFSSGLVRGGNGFGATNAVQGTILKIARHINDTKWSPLVAANSYEMAQAYGNVKYRLLQNKNFEQIAKDINNDIKTNIAIKNNNNIFMAMSGTNFGTEDYIANKNRDLQKLASYEIESGMMWLLQNPKGYGYDYIKRNFKTMQANMNEIDKQYCAGAFYCGLTINKNDSMDEKEIAKMKKDIFLSTLNSGTNNIIGYQQSMKIFIEGYIKHADYLVDNPEIFDGKDKLYLKVKSILGVDEDGNGVNIDNVKDPKIIRQIMIAFADDVDPTGNVSKITEEYFNNMDNILDSKVFSEDNVNKMINGEKRNVKMLQEWNNIKNSHSILENSFLSYFTKKSGLKEAIDENELNNVAKPFVDGFNEIKSKTERLLNLKNTQFDIDSDLQGIIEDFKNLSDYEFEINNGEIINIKKPTYENGNLVDIGDFTTNNLEELTDKLGNILDLSKQRLNNIIKEYANGEVSESDVKDAFIRYSIDFYQISDLANEISRFGLSLVNASGSIEGTEGFSENASKITKKLEDLVTQSETILSLYGGTMPAYVVDKIRAFNPVKSKNSIEDMMVRKFTGHFNVNVETIYNMDTNALIEYTNDVRKFLAESFESENSSKYLPIAYTIYNSLKGDFFSGIKEEERVDLQLYVLSLIINTIKNKENSANDKPLNHYIENVLMSDIGILRAI